MGNNSITNTATGVTLSVSGSPCSFPEFGAPQELYQVTYYSFTPPTSGAYAFSTCGMVSWDSRILVSTACGSAATSLTCDDDGGSAGLSCSSYSSQTAPVALTGGATYFVALGGYSTASYGSGTLRVISAGTAAPTRAPTQATVSQGSGDQSIFDLGSA